MLRNKTKNVLYGATYFLSYFPPDELQTLHILHIHEIDKYNAELQTTAHISVLVALAMAVFIAIYELE